MLKRNMGGNAQIRDSALVGRRLSLTDLSENYRGTYQPRRRNSLEKVYTGKWSQLPCLWFGCFLLPRAQGAVSVSACPALPPVRQAPACGCESGSGGAGVDFSLPTLPPYFSLPLPPPTTASRSRGPSSWPALQFLQGTVPRLPAAWLEVSDPSLCQRPAPRLELCPQKAQLGKEPQSPFQGPAP